MSPERAHHLSLGAFKWACQYPTAEYLTQMMYDISTQGDAIELFGLRFKNRVGLAAGLDKNALVFDEFANFGFGFVEIGTVTPLAQAGNEKPRLFRLVKDKALLNRMGFNNDGVDVVRKRLLQRRRKDIIVGGNIGKNKITPNEEATSDYLKGFEALKDVVDYFVVNVSSPNTPGLRELQDKGPLTQLLLEIQKQNATLKRPKPLLLKIAPDLEITQLADIAEIADTAKLSGIIATNTTIDRSGLLGKRKQIDQLGAGGISGKPLRKKSTDIIHFLHKETNGKLPIIGSGGIMRGDDVKEKLDAGASLIQLYTGFIYRGPALIAECIRAMRGQKK